MLAAILGDIARARGMSEIARASGLTREALYKALRPDAQPRFDTIGRVCTAFGGAFGGARRVGVSTNQFAPLSIARSSDRRGFAKL